MKLSDFHFDLPEEKIARFPVDKRDESRLLVVDRKSRQISHHVFKEIVDLVGSDDFLVVNNSRVEPVRLFGKIGEKRVELLLVERLDATTAEALTMPAKKFKEGARVVLSKSLWAEVIEIGARGRRKLKFNKPLDAALRMGYAPLPPYIKRKFTEAEAFRELDLERYQTVYCKEPGSIAAPTAGLHFSRELLAAIEEKTQVVEITLDVGEATFQKLEVEEIEAHRMGREYITIGEKTVRRINELKQHKSLIAVGTTTVRALETHAKEKPTSETFQSELFITPGFAFKMVDKLLTNFHLPQSSLFILVSAFAGLDLMKAAYAIAIENGYRFFSYGDAMLIL